MKEQLIAWNEYRGDKYAAEFGVGGHIHGGLVPRPFEPEGCLLLPTLGQRETSLSLSLSRPSVPILVSTRTVSVFRLVRLTLGWHAKEAKAQRQQRRQQNGGRVDEGGKHEPLLGEQRDAVVTGEGGRRGTARRR